VTAVGQAIGHSRRIIRVSPGLGYAASRIIGWFMNDVFITREEIKGLMGNVLYVDAPPAGQTRLTHWMQANSTTLGIRYASELARRKTRR
jgi:NADH dehydrogenase